MHDVQIRVTDDGETDSYEPTEYGAEASYTRAVRLIRNGIAYEQDELREQDNLHNEDVLARAKEEDDSFYGTIRVPFWFRDDDEEVRETFDGDDRVTGVVEDYSEKAWRIIAVEDNHGRAGVYWHYAWTFVPKSLGTVTRAVGWSGVEEARRAAADVREARQEAKEARDQEWEDADDWEERLEVLDA